MKYIYYKVDGTHEVIQREEMLSLSELQELCGDTIDIVNFENCTLCLDDDGIANGLGENPFYSPKHQTAYYGNILEGKEVFNEEKGGYDFVGYDDHEQVEIKRKKEWGDIFIKKGTKFTVFWIGDSLPATAEAKLVAAGYLNDDGKPVFKMLRGRKTFTLRADPKELMVFEGHNLPFISDSDMKSVSGSKTVRMNALFNLGGCSKEIIADWVLNRQLNPFFCLRDRVLYIAPDFSEELMFLDVFPSCALVEDMQRAELKKRGHNVI